MDRPMTRRGCAGCGLIWLLVMLLPLLALMIAVRGELSWRRGDFTEDRVWLVRDPGERPGGSAAGLAYSATRLERAGGAPGQVCARTRVYFLLWRGSSESLSYCECYAVGPGGQFDSAGACP
jgi:hypothetical protein